MMNDLAAQVARFGTLAFLMSVTPESKPHVGPIEIAVDGDDLVGLLLPGSRTERNALVNPIVCLHWPGRDDTDGYSLIVDGEAKLESAPNETRIVVHPVKAVLHRLGDPGEDTNACGHDCVGIAL